MYIILKYVFDYMYIICFWLWLLNPIRSLMIRWYMITTTWRKWLHTNILELIFTTSSTQIIALRKWLLGDEKLIMRLKIIVNQPIFGFEIRINSSLRLLLRSSFFMDVRCTPYPILLLEVSLSPIESMAMTRYLMYKNKLNNMEDKRLLKIASKSSHNHHRLKWGWHKDVWSWLKTIGESWTKPFCRIKILLKKTSNQNLRKKCGVIKS